MCILFLCFFVFVLLSYSKFIYFDPKSLVNGDGNQENPYNDIIHINKYNENNEKINETYNYILKSKEIFNFNSQISLNRNCVFQTNEKQKSYIKFDSMAYFDISGTIITKFVNIIFEQNIFHSKLFFLLFNSEIIIMNSVFKEFNGNYFIANLFDGKNCSIQIINTDFISISFEKIKSLIYLEQNSNLLILKCNFLRIKSFFNLFYLINKSILFIKYGNFNNILLYDNADNVKRGFIFNDYNTTIFSCDFMNIILQNSYFFILKSFINKGIILFLKNNFTNTTLSYSKIFDIYFKFSVFKIILSNNYFYQINGNQTIDHSNNNIFYIIADNSHIYTINTTYVKITNVINFNLIDIYLFNQNNSLCDHLFNSICLNIKNPFIIIINNLIVQNSKSFKTAQGLKIKSIEIIKGFFVLNNSRFFNNYLFFSNDTEVSSSIYLKIDIYIKIINCNFINNVLNSSRNGNKYGGACINTDLSNNKLKIFSSYFSNNSAKSFSNCIQFQGYLIEISNAIFFNNTPIIDEIDMNIYLYYHFSNVYETMGWCNGGALFSSAQYTMIYESKFINNNSSNGGSIFIDNSLYYPFHLAIIEKSIFKSNFANFGAGVMTSKIVKNLKFHIKKCFFYKNRAILGASTYFDQKTKNSNVKILESYFYKNKAFEGPVSLSFHKNSNIYFKSNKFLENDVIPDKQYDSLYIVAVLGLIGDSSSMLFLINNIYLYNLAFVAIGAIGLMNGNALVLNEILIGNSAVNRSGAIIVSNGAVFLMKNSKIIDHSAKYRSGSIEITDYSKCYVINCDFYDSKSLEKGGVFFASGNTKLFSKNNLFVNSYSLSGLIIFCYENMGGDIYFKDSIIRRINGNPLHSCFLFELSFAKLYIKNCSFFNISDSGIIYGEKSRAIIFNSIFKDNFYYNNEIIGYMRNSFLAIYQSIIFNIYSFSSTIFLFYLEEYSKLIFKQNLIKNCYSYTTEQSSLFYIYESNLTILKLVTINYFPAFLITTRSIINITNSQFNGTYNYLLTKRKTDSSFQIYDTELLYIDFCIFLNFESYAGSVINLKRFKLLNSNNSFIKNTIINSIFLNNKAKTEGGVIYLESDSLTIKNSKFISNNAIMGGVLYLYSLYQINFYKIIIENTIMLYNSANTGGCIKWINIYPTINEINCFIKDNYALYGDNFATLPSRVILSIYDKNENLIFDSFNNSEIFILKKQAPGQKLSCSLIFRFIDLYNQTITTLNNILEEIIPINEPINFIKPIELLNQKIISPISLFIEGKNLNLIKNGILKFSDLEIHSYPNSTCYLSLIPKSIYYFSNLFLPTNSELNITNRYTYIIPIIFRECIIGEVYQNNSKSCQECPIGRYSFNKNSKDCDKCPPGANCPGGDKVILINGYWKSSNYSTWIHKCIDNDNCLGTELILCSNNFIGPLCKSCIDGYWRTSSDTCISCEGQAINIIRLIGVIIGIFITLFLLIKSTFDNNKLATNLFADNTDKKEIENNMKILCDYHNIYFKILINYLHMIGVISQFPIVWPSYLLEFVNIFSVISSFSSKMMGLECIFFDLSFNDIPIVYSKLIGYNILPFVLIMISIIFMNIANLIKKLKSINSIIYATIIGIFVMLQPTILNENIKILTCIEIDPGSFHIQDYPNVSCDDNIYTKIAFYFALPVFLSWAIGYPLIILLFLFINRNNLFKKEIFFKFNFFFIGYKFKYYFWDFVIMMKKVFIIFIMISNISTYSKIYLILFIVTSIFYFQLKKLPFISVTLNYLEMISYFASLINIYLAFLILLIEDSMKIFCFVVILLINISFLIIWGGLFATYSFKVYRKYFKLYFPKAYSLLEIYYIKSKNKYFAIRNKGAIFSLKINHLIISYSEKAARIIRNIRPNVIIMKDEIRESV